MIFNTFRVPLPFFATRAGRGFTFFVAHPAKRVFLVPRPFVADGGIDMRSSQIGSLFGSPSKLADHVLDDAGAGPPRAPAQTGRTGWPLQNREDWLASTTADDSDLPQQQV